MPIISLNNFWPKLRKYLKITLIFACILSVALIAIYYSQEYEIYDDVEINLVEKPNQEKLILADNITDFIPQIKKEPKIQDKSAANSVNHDNIVQLSNSISLANQKIIALEQEISTLKQQILLNQKKQNISNISLLLIEVNRLKNLAYNGQNFSSRIKNLNLLAKDFEAIQIELRKLNNIAILPSQTEIITKIDALEKNIMQAKINSDPDNIYNKAAFGFSNLIKIKQVKNFDNNDILSQYNQLRQEVLSSNFNNAYNISTSLSQSQEEFKEISVMLEKYVSFSNSFDQIIKFIYLNHDD